MTMNQVVSGPIDCFFKVGQASSTNITELRRVPSSKKQKLQSFYIVGFEGFYKILVAKFQRLYRPVSGF